MNYPRIAVTSLLFALLAQTAFAWESISGTEIATFLSGAQVSFETGEQQAWTENRTVYVDGESSQGQWRIRNERYCSKFGNNSWTCYDVDREGEDIRFTGDDGREWIGRVVLRN
jgi:hypothetical protein